MKKIIILISIVFFTKNLISQNFLEINKIDTIDITFAQNNWDDILDSYYNAGSSFRLIAEVVINGVQFDSVGVRYKGNSSYDASNAKNPFNIKLDFVKGKQNMEGRNVLKLSNIFRDPSVVREVLSYEIARKYMPASMSNFVRLSVNGTYIGLYVNDESTNAAFAERHYFKSNGPFFEGDFSPGAAPAGCAGGPPKVWGYLGTNQACYEQYYAIQSNNSNDWNELIAALDTFNNYTNDIENAIYIDRLLWMLALDNVMVNLDSPLGPPHNFLIYKDGTDRFNPILWDLNQSFGSFTGGGPTTLTPTELKELSPWHNATNTNYPILNIPFANNRYKKMYIAKMKTIFEENFSNDLYSSRISDIRSLIDNEVNNDPNPFYSYSDFNQNVSSTVSGVIGIKELMEDRITFLNNQADFLKIAPEIATIETSPEIVKSNSSVTFTAEISNANYAYLGYRFGPKEKFKKVVMTNSGSTYTASINVEYADVEYYIWAENTDAGVFSPKRAEYEFYSLGVSGDVVINELQASNESTQYDEAAESDDWIELYNNTENAIDLTGYYLSDNKDTLTKWLIPAQNIEVDGYTIFWADKDLAQGQNHTNFSLKRNGESLYLVNPSGNIIDQITYPYQERDLSYSRFPNGTGAFKIKTPTFNKSNGDTLTSIHNLAQEKNGLILFPNPGQDYIQIINKYEKSIIGNEISVYSLLGEKVIQQKWQKNKQEIINISSLSNGIYFIKIEGNQAIRFIKNE